eukprot:256096-Chlamydomonas_euryale.AAC.14
MRAWACTDVATAVVAAAVLRYRAHTHARHASTYRSIVRTGNPGRLDVLRAWVFDLSLGGNSGSTCDDP